MQNKEIVIPPVTDRKTSANSKTYKLQGFLDKRGLGTIGKGWKKRYFELDADNLYYYLFNEENKVYKGAINVGEIKTIAPRENINTSEGYEFFIDTPTRRYELRTSEGEYVMWYWIEGIKSTQARILARKRSEEILERKNKKQTFENEFVLSEIQTQLKQLKERYKHAEEEWRMHLNGFKRRLHAKTKELQARDKEIAVLSERCEKLTREVAELHQQQQEHPESAQGALSLTGSGSVVDMTSPSASLSSTSSTEMTTVAITTTATTPTTTTAAPTITATKSADLQHTRPLATSTPTTTATATAAATAGTKAQPLFRALSTPTLSTAATTTARKMSAATATTTEDEDDEEELRACELLKEAEEEIKQLKEKQKAQNELVKKQNEEILSLKEEHLRMKRRLENEISSLKEQLSLEARTRGTLQDHNRELESQVQQIHTQIRTLTSSGALSRSMPNYSHNYNHNYTATSVNNNDDNSSNMMTLNNSSSSSSRDHGLPPWVPDDLVDKCKLCKGAFSLWRRKHHCRTCGDIFCAKCTSNTVFVLTGFYANMRIRVCTSCYATTQAGVTAVATGGASAVHGGSSVRGMISEPGEYQSRLTM